MANYEVTFTENVKLGTDTYRKGEKSVVEESVLKELENVIEPEYTEVKEEAKTIGDMTAKELKAYAKEHKIELEGAAKREELLEVIQAHEEAQKEAATE